MPPVLAMISAVQGSELPGAVDENTGLASNWLPIVCGVGLASAGLADTSSTLFYKVREGLGSHSTHQRQ
jgi:hypothetical protein